MKRLATCCLLLLALAGAALGELEIGGKDKAEPGTMVRLDVGGDLKLSEKSRVIWRVKGLTLDPATGKPVVADCERVGTKLIFTGPPGAYEVSLRVVDFKAELFDEGERTVVIGVPPPPLPPVPPVPPAPLPPPTPAGELRVLVVFEETEAGAYPKEQHSIIYGKKFADALDAKTPYDPVLKRKKWNIFDKDVNAKAMPKEWQDALARERKSLPWIVLFGDAGAVRYEGPLPKTVNEAIDLLNKHAPLKRKAG